ncbi:MAG: hypothetical protein ACFCUS_14395 [Rubrimonas sp.]|uniref:hypothetical protein n=1 Tax=Rubrimonas sp. TaxID=2036015 RepID=UPI002FDCE53C
MLLGFLAAIAVAIFAASVAFTLRRAMGIQARWLVPASAGAALLGFTLWNDYSWFGRQVSGLPPEIVVVDSFEHSAALQPWTLVAPVVNRYRALDLRTISRSTANPEIVRGLVYLAQRYQPTFETLQLVDCGRGLRADAADAGPDGLPPDAAWRPLPEDDPLRRAFCATLGETG